MDEEADYLGNDAAEVGAPIEVALTAGEAAKWIKNMLLEEWNSEYAEISYVEGRRLAALWTD